MSSRSQVQPNSNRRVLRRANLGLLKMRDSAKWALLCVSALISCSSDDPERADVQSLLEGDLTPAPAVFGPLMEGQGGAATVVASNSGNASGVSLFGDDSLEQRVDPPRTTSQYCGDGAYDPEVEECDDGVGTGLDVCSQDCQTRDLLAVPGEDGGENVSRKLGLGRHPISGGPLGSALTWVDVSEEPKVVVQLRDTYGNRSASESPEVVVADANGVEADETRPVINSNPVVASLPDGTHVVAYNDLNGDGNELGVALRPVSHLTGTLGDVQYANTTTVGAQHDADLLWTEEGLVAAWVDTSDELNGPDIRYRVYDASLEPITDELTLAASYQPEAAVTLSAARGAAPWAAAWRRGEAGSGTDAHEAIVVSHGGEQIEFTPRVLLEGENEIPSAEPGGGMGGADAGYRRMMPGHIDDRIGLAPLGDDLFAVAFTVGTDPENTGVANVFRIWIAVVDFVAEGVIWIDEVAGPDGHDETHRQRSPALVDASLSGGAGSVILSWREDSILGNSDGEDLWLKRFDWDADSNALVIPNLELPLAPLVRNETSRPGDQRRPALANVLVPGGRALSMVWEDWGTNFDTDEGAQARPDLAIQVAPLPLRRGDDKRFECSPLEPCSSGQGHCDNDDDCVAGNVCVTRRGPWHGYGPATNVCEPAHCTDKRRSGGEVGVDCGGECGPCFPCLGSSSSSGTAHYCSAVCPCASAEGDCDSDFDCELNEETPPLSCVESAGDRLGLPVPIDVCLTAECNDGVRNGQETGVDCGGSFCPPCLSGTQTFCAEGDCVEGEGHCTSDADCAGANLVCGEEQGVYYGLPSGTNACVPAACAERPAQFDPRACTSACKCGSGGGSCHTDSDCLSTAAVPVSCVESRGLHYGNSAGLAVCVADQCFNGVKDANELRVDCGGPCGSECAVCDGDSTVTNFEQAAELWTVESGNGVTISQAAPVFYGSGSLEFAGCDDTPTILVSAPFSADAFDTLGDSFLFDFATDNGSGAVQEGSLGAFELALSLRHDGQTLPLVERDMQQVNWGQLTRIAQNVSPSVRDLIGSGATNLQLEVRVHLLCDDAGAKDAFLRLDHMQFGGENQVFRSTCAPESGAVTTDAAVLGFDNVALWPLSGLIQEGADVRQGIGAGRRDATDHTITSVPIGLGYGTPTRLLLDVKLPTSTTDSTSITTTLSCPSRGVYTAFSQSVAPAQTGDWVTLPFHLSDAEIAKLDHPASDCTVSIQTSHAAAGDVLYDDLRFAAPGHCTNFQQVDGLASGGARFALGMPVAMNGVGDNPYKLCTAEQVQHVMDNSSLWASNFELAADIDLHGVVGQIGTAAAHYQGTFDGKGHVLSNYTLDASGVDHVGFFGRVNGDGTENGINDGIVRNLTVSNFDVTGENYVGAITGTASGATIEDVYSVDMDIDARAYAGVVGWATADTSIHGVFSSGSVDVSVSQGGGLVGQLDASVLRDSASSAVVRSEQLGDVGGAVGFAQEAAELDSVSATGATWAPAGTGTDVGGLVGQAEPGTSIRQCSATGQVDGASQVGGLIGRLLGGASASTVRGSWASGQVTGSGNDVGGLVGQVVSGHILDSSASGAIEGNSQVAGLVGGVSASSKLARVFASGRVEGNGSYAGGLVGYCLLSQIDDAFATGNVSATGNASGGLVGYYQRCDVSRVLATGQATGGSIAGPDNDQGGTPSTFVDAFGSAELEPERDPIASPGYGGTNLDAAQLLQKESFTNFDFFTTWEMGENHPTLRRSWCQLYDQPDDFETVVGRYAPNGDADKPFVLCTREQFEHFIADPSYLTKNFVLGADIDLTGVNGRIGTEVSAFRGTFDGAGHSLSNYTRDTPTESYSALFAYMYSTAPVNGHLDGEIKNLRLENFSIGGNSHSAALIGVNQGVVSNVTVASSEVVAHGTDASAIGGVVGQNYFGTISATSVESIDVSCQDSSCGGIAGQNHGGLVRDSHAESGVVRGGTGLYKGGLLGHNDGVVERSSSSVTVEAPSASHVGGLVGYSSGESSLISDCRNYGAVQGWNHVGGIVGTLSSSAHALNSHNDGHIVGNHQVGGVSGQTYDSEIIDSTSAAPVEASIVSGSTVAGGLAGFVNGGSLIQSCFATGQVFANRIAGGLVGQLGSAGTEVRESRAQGAVSGEQSVGGLVGIASTNSSVFDSTASGHVWGVSSQVGGVVGQASSGAYLENCEAQGAVEGTADRSGGLVGDLSDSTVVNSQASGRVTVEGGDRVGGFVGRVQDASVVRRGIARGDVACSEGRCGGFSGNVMGQSVLTDCRSEGDVTSAKDEVGGAVGELVDSTLRDVSALGIVRGNSKVGGLVGEATGGLVEDSSARNRVTGSDSKVGGLVGQGVGGLTVLRSFAEGDVSAALAWAGGLVGEFDDSTMIDSYATGSVTALTEGAAGLIGEADGSTITNSYHRGGHVQDLVDPDDEEDLLEDTEVVGAVIGGAVGSVEGITLTSVYGDGVVNGDMLAFRDEPDHSGVALLSASEMSAEASFVDWDFQNTWQMSSDGPTLRSGYCIKTEQQDGAPFAVVAPGDLIPNGTQDSPYILCTASQLAHVMANSNLWGDYFELGQNIEVSSVSGQIGTQAAPFTGVFDGQGFALINYSLSTTSHYGGLFGYVARPENVETGPRIMNLQLVSPVVTGTGYVGSLAGYVEDGVIENVEVLDGAITGAAEFVGGLAGQIAGPLSRVTDSAATAQVSGDERVGGLVGYATNGALLEGSHASGAVLAQTATSSRAGGLVGAMEVATLWDSHSTSAVNVSGTFAGGLVGHATNSALAVCSATGDVTAVDFAGGLIGFASNTSIARCWATGDATATGNDAGGLLGAVVNGIVTDAYATGDVSGNRSVGGLVGDAQGTSVMRVYAKGSVSGTGSLGVLIGRGDSGVYLASSFGPSSLGLPAVGNLSGAGVFLIADDDFGDWNTFASEGWEFGSIWRSGSEGPTLGSGAGELSNEPCLQYAHDNTEDGIFLRGMPVDPDGSAANPWPLCSAMHIQRMIDDSTLWGDHFALLADVNLDGVIGQIAGTGEFTGVFDGRGHRLIGYSHTGTQLVGLFRSLGSGAAVRNLRLENFVVSGGSHVGALAGQSSGAIERVALQGGSVSSTDGFSGGMIGVNDGDVRDVSALDVDVTCAAAGCGGLFGATAENSSLTDVEVVSGLVSSGAGTAGGLVGQADGALSNCTSGATVDAAAASYVGGLVGYALGTIQESAVNGTVTGDFAVGGLAGAISGTGRIFSSKATGQVTGRIIAGGLVGQVQAYGRVFDSFATGATVGDSIVGGLIGHVAIGGATVVERVWASGDVTGNVSQAGGLIGYAEDLVVADALALGDVSGGVYAGALLGQADGALVAHSLAVGAASGTSEVGAIVGYADSQTHFFGTMSSQSANGSLPLVGNVSDGVVGASLAAQAQLADSQTFASQGWDLADVWKLEGTTPTLIDREGELPYCERYEQQATWPMQLPFSIGADEDGSAAKPYRICTPLQWVQLFYNPEWMRHNFVVAAHLDMSSVGFYLGNSNDPFTGTVDGDGHILFDFTNANEGLFGVVEGDGVVDGQQDGRLLNLNVARFAVSSPYDDLGGFVGTLSNGSVENVHARGMSVAGNSIAHVGGLVGSSTGIIDGVSLVGAVTGDGATMIGGVVGLLEGRLENAATYGSVRAEGVSGASTYVNVGGAVGRANGATIENSSSFAGVHLAGGRRAGGFAGSIVGGSAMVTSHAYGDVTGAHDAHRLGGLIGRTNESTLTRSTAHGDVTGPRVLGGLIGEHSTNSVVTECSASGDSRAMRAVLDDGTVMDGSYVGGLIGYTNTEGGDVSRSFATGDAYGYNYVGGLIGRARNTKTNTHIIQDCAASGDVKGDNNHVGGLIGHVERYALTRTVSSGVVVAGPMANVGTHIGNASTSHPPTFDMSFAVSSHAPGMAAVGVGGGSGVMNVSLAMFTSPSVPAQLGWDFDSTWEMLSSGPALRWTEPQEGWCGTYTQVDAAPFVSGVSPLPDGSAENPYRLCTAAQIQTLMTDLSLLDEHFVLEADIGLGGINPTTSSTLQIGSWDNEFSGVFDGNGHILSDYSLHMTTAEAGFFGAITGRVEHLRLTGFDVSGTVNVGALTGVIKPGGVVRDVIVSGGLVYGTDDDIGGIVGDIKAGGLLSSSVGAIRSEGFTANDVGGVAGINEGTVSYCEGRGSVAALGDDYSRAGGLVGLCMTSCLIEHGVARGAVDAHGDIVGGLVGDIQSGSIVRDSVAYGNVTCTPEQLVGGFLGRARDGAVIERSEAHGDVAARRQAGGFAGQLNNQPVLTECAAYGDVVTSDDYAGGFAGYTTSTGAQIVRSFSRGDATGDQYVGGFIGYSNTSTVIDDSYSTGDVDGNYRAGGFIGRANNTTIRRSYSFGSVDVAPSGQDGDFIGRNSNNSFTSCYALAQSHPTFGYTPSGSSTSGVKTLSTNKFGKASEFSGFNFSTVWVTPETSGVDRPELQWED